MSKSEKQILDWLANGETGLSSKTMALTALGSVPERISHPLDPADFNRCLLLLKKAPVVRKSFPQIAALSKEWAALIYKWHEIEQLFLQEAGLDWSNAQRAPKTYELMKRVMVGRKAAK